jgi:hypothetical protein
LSAAPFVHALPLSPFELRWNDGTKSFVDLIRDDSVVRAQHQDDAEQSPRLILKRGHQDPCPEARAVLSDSPAIHLDRSAARKKKVVLGFAGFSGLGRVEPGKVAGIPLALAVARF